MDMAVYSRYMSDNCGDMVTLRPRHAGLSPAPNSCIHAFMTITVTIVTIKYYYYYYY